MTSNDHAPPSEMDLLMTLRAPPEVGQVIKGTVVLVGQSHVFLDIGGKSEASLEIEEVRDDEGEITMEVGQEVQAYVVSVEPEITLSYKKARSHLNIQALEDARDMGVPVEGKVTKLNKGGLEIDLGGTRAFCPISQIELGYCEDASVFLEQKLQFRIIEFKDEGRNVVVSRRALLEEERQEAAEITQAQLQEGAEFEGTVVSLQPFGAFVDIGGLQGMVHISEISHSRIEHPADVLKDKQTVRVKVIKVEPDPKHEDRLRIGLSIRQMQGDPWDETTGNLSEGDRVNGKVVRLQPFGAFVEIAPGVDGLIHVSELSDRRLKHPDEVLSVGDMVEAGVLKVDRAARRISLSLRSDEGSGSELMVGAMVEVVVDQVKPFGLLVNIKGGGRNARGLVPAEETGAGRQANLRRQFPVGKELHAMIISLEPSGKMRLSLTAAADQAEQGDYEKFMKGGGSTKSAKPKAEGSLGSLGDALMKALKKDK
jgi:small subunit ribosomal protein S1